MRKLLINILKKSPACFIYNYFKKKQLHRIDSGFFDTNKQMLEFYSSLVNSGDLVFDIGANFGNRSKVFAQIGAKVIAFEPQAACAEYLKSYFWFEANVHIEQVALGEDCTSAIMKISNNSVLSTLSDEYIDRSVKCGRFSKDSWQDSQTVQVKTLDHYINKYGCPKFAKIDVEGFEFEVLKGLTHAIPIISVEFATENKNTNMACIDKLINIGDYVFQFSEEECFQLHSEKWIDARAIKDQIDSFNGLEWGDVYCRLKKNIK
jgi:FkbM family methyltransferase